ncbi:CDGSH iron-sulfur domain-containing protein [Streptomyces sp. NPDC053493]|uniref:CDGSH iron-sulfur domain-containing protein n=1 Tax=Streptomyces sp. NPDC053493 TaxID=3365705 RepID=UPI0037CFC0A6
MKTDVWTCATTPDRRSHARRRASARARPGAPTPTGALPPRRAGAAGIPAGERGIRPHIPRCERRCAVSVSDERPRVAARITPVTDGPLLVEGPVEIVLPDGTVRRSDRPVVALCMCRRSLRGPFCDTSHRRRMRRARPEERERTEAHRGVRTDPGETGGVRTDPGETGGVRTDAGETDGPR